MSSLPARALVVALVLTAPAAAQLAVTSTSPALNAGNVPTTAPISVTFDRPVNPATFTPAAFGAFAKWSGPVNGALAFSDGDRTVTLTPARALVAGEAVTLVMSRDLRAADGSALRNAGYTLSFSTAVRPSARVFRERAVISNRTGGPGGPQTRIYGGLACDVNRDGWPDLTIINEVSADIRVLLNRADGSGLFGPLLTPHTGIPVESSPNEPADFNRDGFVDLVTSSNAENKIAVCLGLGNGSFDPPNEITVGAFPRGFGILDADGDGDLDIAVAQAGANRISLFRNNGIGIFGNPTHFEGGVDGEYGMTAADMNADGIADLVVGGVNSRTVSILLGNGDGTFTQAGVRPIGGSVWVLVCADLNGDGDLDVSAANSFSNNGSVLLGNGDGTLDAAATLATSGHTVATDLADFDGDGDADMVLSSFGGGRWHTFLNDGAGVFSPFRVFTAPANPACCLPADFDLDGDIDLALIDEIADVVVMMANVCPADLDARGGVTVDDIFAYLGLWFAGDPDANFDPVPVIDVADIFAYLSAWFSGCV